ncbi:phage holin family protein [Clostridium tertium]
MDFLQNGLLKLLPMTIAILVLAYLGCKFLDMLLGVLKTWKNGNYRSGKMRDGIVRWIAEMVAIVFVISIDLVLGLNFYLCGFTLSLFIYKEAGSILENLTECGVELPSVVAEKLEIFNKKEIKEQE